MTNASVPTNDVRSDLADDDAPIGRVLTRREVLAILGSVGVAACAPAALNAASPSASATSAVTPTAGSTQSAPAGGAVATPACIVRPALTEGPYFVDEKLNRSDIRSDPSNGSVRPGIQLALTFNVSRVGSSGCTALANAQVDVWHCDAAGVYSDVDAARGQKFLRGYQMTDASGKASFATVYPGWYQGRAVHIHFKIRTSSGGQTADFTSQLFFDDAINAEVYAQPPYAQRGSGWPRNAQDGIYTGGGDKLLLKPAKSGAGYTATFDIGLA